jgi:hypothetical protein
MFGGTLQALPGARIRAVPFGPYPLPPHEPALDRVAVVLDPILALLGFAAGQAGATHGDSEFRWTVMRDPDGNEFA